jgi:hypothetical protein
MHYSSSGGGGGGYHELQNIIKGVPIQCMVRLKPQVGYQKEDLRLNGNRIGILDAQNRGKL